MRRKTPSKRCTKCGVTKTISCFGKHSYAPDGHRAQCRECTKVEGKEYASRPDVKERARLKNLQWVAANRQRTKENLARWHLENKPRRNAEARARREDLMKQFSDYGMHERAKSRARKLGVPFDLELGDISIPDVCPVLGIPLFLRHSKNGPCRNSPSLDRLDPKGGYTKDNVVVISHRANTLKNDATLDEIRAVLAYMTNPQAPTVARLLAEREKLVADVARILSRA